MTRLPLIEMDVPATNYALGRTISVTSCRLCPMDSLQDGHSMVLKEVFCRSPDCPQDCRVKLRLRMCLRDHSVRRWYSHGTHSPVTATRPAAALVPGRRLRPPSELLALIERHPHEAPLALLLDFQQQFPELAEGIERSQVANLVERRRQLTRTHHLVDIMQYIRLFNGVAGLPGSSASVSNANRLAPEQPFAFGPHVEQGAFPQGEFLVGVTCRKAIMLLRDAPDPLVMHVDSTFGCNSRRYPVAIIGLSDRQQHFHPLAAFIMKQETTEVWEEVIKALLQQSWEICRERLNGRIRYVVSDAADPIWGAVREVLPEATHLMCWYHLKQAVRGQLNAVNLRELAKPVLSLLNSMHSATQQHRFEQLVDEARTTWPPEFFAYFQREWLSNHSNWQVFRRPPAVAMTNNCLEATHGTFKRTLKPRPSHSLPDCIRILGQFMSRWSSRDDLVFAEAPSPDAEMRRGWQRKIRKLTCNVSSGQVVDGPSTFNISGVSPNFVCTCPDYCKDGLCHHAYAFFLAFTGEAAPNRARGRPRRS